MLCVPLFRAVLLLLAAGLLGLPLLASAQDADEAATLRTLLEKNRQQVEEMRNYSRELMEQFSQIRGLLAQSEERAEQQAEHIRDLEQELAVLRSEQPRVQQEYRQRFFRLIADRVPDSPVMSVQVDRVILHSDQIFVYGNAKLGAEGMQRLQPLAEALRMVVETMPGEVAWRLRVEGHTDSRPVRAQQGFSSNWELSAARAVGVVHYLRSQGVTGERLEAVGLSDTIPLDSEENKAAWRRNRRVELHLHFPQRTAAGD